MNNSASASIPTCPDTATLSEILSRTVGEIERIAVAGRRVERGACSIEKAATTNAQTLEDLQMMDHMLQSLDALQMLFVQLSRTRLPETQIDLSLLVRDIPLEDIKRRMMGDVGSAPREGVAELF